MSQPETQVAVLSMAEIVAKSPDPVAAIKNLGATIARSMMFGKTDRVEMGEVIVLFSLTSGITLPEIMRTYQLSFGKLEKRIDAAVGEFKARGGRIEWLADGSDGKQARAKFTLADESLEASCTVAEAVKAGWTKNEKWETEPTTMLRARVKKRGLVALAPDIFFGEFDETTQGTVEVDPEKMAKAAAVEAARPAPRQTAPTPTPASAPAQSVQPTAATPPAPAATPTPAPAPVAAAGPGLTEEVEGKLVAIIGAEKVPQATAWAVSVGWLKPGQTLSDLPPKHAGAIIALPARFVTKLDEWIAKGGAK